MENRPVSIRSADRTSFGAANGSSRTQLNGQIDSSANFIDKMTPAVALTLMAAWIFFAEVGFMFLLANLPEMPTIVEALVDGTTLMLIISPSYFLLYRPFKKNWETNQLRQQEIRRLSHRLLNSTENEKRSLARDLHDEFGQILTGLQFEIELVKQDIDSDPETARSQCSWISDQLTELSDRVRHISRTLRPSMLDTAGLAATLRWLIKTVASHQNHLHFDLQIPVDCRLPAHIETIIYRLTQEAINNICKHSEADKVEILLDIRDDMIKLMIHDNGLGFAPQALERKAGEGGLGLVGMRERVVACHGTLTLDSQPGQGCSISVLIPRPSKEF